METKKQQPQDQQETTTGVESCPDETSGLLIEAHLKIWDPVSKEELVNTRS